MQRTIRIKPEFVSLATRIIGKSNREHPADAVMRQEYRAVNILPHESALVSRIIFAYYRWLGWLDPKVPSQAAFEKALKLDEAFADNPQNMKGKELQRALPAWALKLLKPTEEWLRALQTESPLWLRTQPGKARELSAALGNCQPGPLPDSLLYRGEMDLFKTEGFQSGQFELQDLASQAVGFVCHPQPDQKWWDACAGEGGKLLHLAALMQNKGIIWGSDRAEWRLKRLKQRTARAAVFNYRAALWNGGAKLPTKTLFDGVLLDAPCSGLGTWQRNPHARWTTTEKDVLELAEVQTNLLGHAAMGVKPGGILVYAVCTITAQETVGVKSEFEAAHPHFEPLALRHPLSPDEPPSATLWIWPGKWPCNAMFICAWRKRG